MMKQAQISGTETEDTGRRALVIGGSLAGLLAARVLADHFERVTVVERDQLPIGPEPRKGVPQARHLHILLVGGLRILAHLFPGITAELSGHGAVSLNWSREMSVLLPTGWIPPFDSDLVSEACSRDLLEWLIRRRLVAHERVTFLTGQQGTGLLTTPARRRVTGVKLRPHGRVAVENKAPQTLPADLVVDASGRGSRLPQWLTDLGYNAPQETTVNSFLGYATRWFQTPEGHASPWKAMVINARPPHFPRGAGLLPAENGQWVLTLAGSAGDYPPTDEAGFMAFLRSLPNPTLYEAVQDATPLTPIYGYRRTANRWRHYERLRDIPEGIITLGDAVCAFNPVYGQGMTASAQAALVLDQCLRQESAGAGLARRFQRRLAKVNGDPWLLATGEDYRWPETEGNGRNWMTRLMHRYVDEVLQLIPHHPAAARAFLEVMHLVTPPSALFRPAVLSAVLRQRLGLESRESSQTEARPARMQE